jgi:outer membrane lipoprotein SlyB
MKTLLSGGALFVAVLAAGCAYEPTYRVYDAAPAPLPAPAPVARIEYGTVEAIEWYRGGQSSPLGLGAILGGAAGGIIGHQIGSGSGNTAATIAGAVGGAIVGNQIERARADDRYRVIVRLDSGATLAVGEVGEGELRVGDRVRVVNGRVYRV